MSSGLDSRTINGSRAKTEFFLSDRDGEGARRLREQIYEFSHRVYSLYAVDLEISRSPPSHSGSCSIEAGEWVTLSGPRESLDKAKDFVLSSFMPKCRLELASSTHLPTSEALPPPSSSTSMAHAVHSNHYHDALCLPPSTVVPLSRNLSPSPPSSSSLLAPVSYQSSSLSSHDHRLNCLGLSPSPPYPPSVETRTRVEHTPSSSCTTSSIDSEEQLHNTILQLHPEKLKKLLLDATKLRHQQVAVHRSQIAAAGGGEGGNSLGGARGPRLLSRSPNQEREKKIDYFVNTLLYPREKVESVLDQLGPDAANNDILERLVKVCKPNAKVSPVATGNGGASNGSSGGGGFGVYKSHRYPSNTGGSSESLFPPSQFSPPLPPSMSSGGGVVPQSSPLPVQDPARLRHIVIDGSNVAMRHGSGQFFSCRGIELAVDFFRKRGHDKITVFVPEWRKEVSKPETPIEKQEVLHSLEREGILKYTPSRRIRGKRVACYDDRFILNLAAHEEGVIVSNDQFRDLIDDKPEWRDVVETRLLPFQFVDDYFMIPEDPMGKDGPMLDQMLVKDPRDVPGRQKPLHSNSAKVCPYLEKCTFGKKCKFYHPEREARNEVVTSSSTAAQNSTSPVSNLTPNNSRSATPSPSPEKWYSRYSNSNRSSGEDLRGLQSNNRSMDDLSAYHQVNGTVDISELQHIMQGSLRIHDGPGQSTANAAAGGQSYAAGYYDPRQQRSIPPQSMNLAPISIHSAPVFSNSADSASTPAAESHHPHRYTFPMAVVQPPHHIKSRTHIITEQHRLPASQVTGGGGGGAGVGGVGGVVSAMGIPPLPPELDPNLVFQNCHAQPHQFSANLSGYYQPSQDTAKPSPQTSSQPPPPQSSNPVSPHQGSGGGGATTSQSMPGVFLTRDGWLPPTTHYSPTPHELHGHSRGGSLIQAGQPPPPAPHQLGYYPSSQGQPNNGLHGFNSRGVSADSNHQNPHSHSMGSAVSVPSTHTSPYHHRHHHQHQQQLSQHERLQGRHHSIDYGNPQNVSPHRRRSSFNEGQKLNGYLPQASTASGYGGSPYYQDYNQQAAATSSAIGRQFNSHHQSNVFAQSTHVPISPVPSSHPLPPPPPSSSSHYHLLPAVNEKPYENGVINCSLFIKAAAVFPGCDETVMSVMMAHPHVSDFEELVRLIQQAVVSH